MMVLFQTSSSKPVKYQWILYQLKSMTFQMPTQKAPDISVTTQEATNISGTWLETSIDGCNSDNEYEKQCMKGKFFAIKMKIICTKSENRWVHAPVVQN